MSEMELTQMLHWSGAGKDGPHHRYNPLLGLWGPVNHQRKTRPNLMLEEDVPEAAGFCPFCWEYFDRELNSVLVDDSGLVNDLAEEYGGVVISNAWPYATGAIVAPQRKGAPEGGSSEVIICKRHVMRFEELRPDEAHWLLGTMAERMQEDRGRHAHTLGFLNEGVHSGGTIPHLHAQVLSLGYVGGTYKAERTVDGGDCVLCEVGAFEENRGRRLVTKSGDVVAWVPWWMDSNEEVIITSRSHTTQLESSVLADLSRVSVDVARALRGVLGTKSRRWAFHGSEKDNIHWHIHVYNVAGKLTMSGVDMGIGVQDSSPEQFAGFLRATQG